MASSHLEIYKGIYEHKLNPIKHPERVEKFQRNIKLIIEFDGTNYCGWQTQENGPTIQEELEKALFKLTDERVVVNGAGRTDSGVHGKAMTANFYTNCRIPGERISLALNCILPEDIVIKNSCDVDMLFHARFDAKGKHYRYWIRNSQYPSAYDRHYSWWIKYCEKLDVEKMRQAAKHYEGTHDFSSCMAMGSKITDAVRTIHSITIEENGEDLYIDFKGNGFLYNMVRIITGTLVYCGIGRLEPADIPLILEKKDRKLGGITVPPQGLHLMEVYY